MEAFAKEMRYQGYILRSGGARGADKAFEKGAVRDCEIYLADDATQLAMAIAKSLHPAWDRMEHFGKMLHGRNVMQVLGWDLQTPSEFVVCWTPDGCIKHSERTQKTGGTGTAISIASKKMIPVYNLHRQEHLEWIEYKIERESKFRRDSEFRGAVWAHNHRRYS